MKVGKQIGPEIGFSPDFLFWVYFALISYFGIYLFSFCHSGTYFGTYLVSGRRPETYFLAGRLDRKSEQINIDSPNLTHTPKPKFGILPSNGI